MVIPALIATAVVPLALKAIDALSNRGKNKASSQHECQDKYNPHDRYESRSGGGGAGGSYSYENTSNTPQVTASVGGEKIQGSPKAIAWILNKLGINSGNRDYVASNRNPQSANYYNNPQPINYNIQPTSPTSDGGGGAQVINLVIG